MSSEASVVPSSTSEEVSVSSSLLLTSDDDDDDDDAKCDESKCVSYSHGLTDIFGYSPTCYADHIMYPMMCSHGYIPHIIDTEPSINNGVYQLGTLTVGCGDADADADQECYGISYQYFTCCPPNLPLDINVSRHCSNSSSVANVASSSSSSSSSSSAAVVVADINNNNSSSSSNSTMVCEDENRQYPREMTNINGFRESFVCCDSIIEHTNNDTINFLLNETECVPFSTASYRPSVAMNIYGRIRPVFCDNENIYSDFRFPRIVKITNYVGIYYFYHYECCKTGSNVPPFIADTTFKKTIFPQIAVSSIAVISCILLITALIIPLWLHVREKRESANTRTRVNSSSDTNPRTGSNRSRIQGTTTMQSSFSGYNLYLVYLAIPDMILNIFLLGMYSSFANQKYNPTYFSAVIIAEWLNHPFEGAFAIACSTANLYLNCVISYQVLILLRNSYNATRCDPPSLVKVSLQAAFVYLFAILVFIIHYVIGRTSRKSLEQSDGDRFHYLTNVNLYWSLVVTYMFPLIFFSYVWVTIWFRGYMPSATGKMKQLVWYFFRIFIIFNMLWLPGICLVVIGASETEEYGNLICIGYLFCGIQPILSTCMAMSKSDVRKYTKDLITLSYIRTAKD